jgi:hypothetical protein
MLMAYIAQTELSQNDFDYFYVNVIGRPGFNPSTKLFGNETKVQFTAAADTGKD